MLSVLSSPMFFIGVLITLVVWIVLLTIIIIKDRRFYNRLLTGNKEKSLESVLNEIRTETNTNKLRIENLDSGFKNEVIKSDSYLQKIGFTRFNPFEDTGGQQSFIVSFLDRKNNGFVLSSLFGRSGTRWFAKIVKQGIGEQVELSKEEKEVVDKA